MPEVSPELVHPPAPREEAAAAGPAAQTKEPQIVKANWRTQWPRFFYREQPWPSPSKPEPRLYRHAPHRSGASHFAKRGRVYRRSQRCEIHHVENIVRRNPQIERTVLFDRDRLVQRHVQTDLSRPFQNIAPRVAKC